MPVFLAIGRKKTHPLFNPQQQRQQRQQKKPSQGPGRPLRQRRRGRGPVEGPRARGVGRFQCSLLLFVGAGEAPGRAPFPRPRRRR